METLLVITITLLGITSLAITCYAIIQILSNDFKDSKPVWIMISMMAFVGPILWFTYTRKQIIKREQGYRIPSYQQSAVAPTTPGQPFLKRILSGLTTQMKYSFSLALGFIAFGYLQRIGHIYLFWESTTLGFLIFMITLLFALQIQIKTDNQEGRKSSNFKAAFWAVIAVIGIQTVIIVTLFFTKAYRETKIKLQENTTLQAELGNIQSFTLLPNGSFQFEQYGDKTAGHAVMHIIIKGEHKYAMVYVVVGKSLESEWEIEKLIRR